MGFVAKFCVLRGHGAGFDCRHERIQPELSITLGFLSGVDTWAFEA